MNWWAPILCLVVGYGFGLIPTGLIVGKLYNVDLRNTGSHNTGMTNAMRSVGLVGGLITFIGDMAKCWIAVAICVNILAPYLPGHEFIIVLLTGLGTTLGHNFPFYMNFKGGKGIAVAGALYIALSFYGGWMIFVISILTFLVVAILTKYVSLGSLVALTVVFITTILFGQLDMIEGLLPEDRIYAYIITAILVVLAFIMHRENIKRLINGNENKFSIRKEDK